MQTPKPQAFSGYRFPALYCLVLLMFAVGNFCFAEPFGGLDEGAHYSSMRQIADAGSIPIYGKSFFSELFDKCNARTLDSREDRDRFRIECNEESVESYKTTSELNYEAQHPPLYYLLLAPLEKLTEGLSLASQLLLLRLASFCLALAGIAMAMMPTRRGQREFSRRAMLGFLAYPIVFPMFWDEFARMGNDSLCLLLTGALALMSSRIRHKKTNLRTMFWIGCLLGFGLLTKGLFIPVVAGYTLFFARGLLTIGSAKRVVSRLNNWSELIAMLVPALALGGGWYIYKFLVFGDIVGGDDAIKLAAHGGLLSTLAQSPPAPKEIADILSHLIYNGIGFPPPFQLGDTSLRPIRFNVDGFAVTVFLLIVTYGFLRDDFHQKNFTHLVPGLAWIAPLFALGLVINSLRLLELEGGAVRAIIGGWYLHILLPWVAPRLGIGWTHYFKDKKKQILSLVLLLGFTLRNQIVTIPDMMVAPYRMECSHLKSATAVGCVSNYDAFVHYYPLIYPFALAGVLCYALGIMGVFLICKNWPEPRDGLEERTGSSQFEK